MKKLHCLALVAAFATVRTDARVITLTQQGVLGVAPGVTEVFVESYEVAEVLSFPTAMNINSTLEVIKDGRTARFQKLSVTDNYFDRVVVAGPATIRLVVGSTSSAGLCTVKITPESYPPDKSILVAPGSGGANVSLEWSTNLVNWTSTTNGVYTNLPVAAFFRINATRIP